MRDAVEGYQRGEAKRKINDLTLRPAPSFAAPVATTFPATLNLHEHQAGRGAQQLPAHFRNWPARAGVSEVRVQLHGDARAAVKGLARAMALRPWSSSAVREAAAYHAGGVQVIGSRQRNPYAQACARAAAISPCESGRCLAMPTLGGK